jgi:hypothetical protein
LIGQTEILYIREKEIRGKIFMGAQIQNSHIATIIHSMEYKKNKIKDKKLQLSSSFLYQCCRQQNMI